MIILLKTQFQIVQKDLEVSELDAFVKVSKKHSFLNATS